MSETQEEIEVKLEETCPNAVDNLNVKKCLRQTREARLESMRVAQKKLKMKRQKEIECLREEVEWLKKENQILRTANYDIVSEYSGIIDILDKKGITLERFLTLSNLQRDCRPKDGSQVEEFDYMPLILLQDKYNEIDFPNLYLDNVFILKVLTNKYLECCKRQTSYTILNPITQNSFKYVSIYGLALPSIYCKQQRMVALEDKVPKAWIKPKNIPHGSFGILEVIDMIANTFDPETMIMEVFLGFLLRYCYATIYGGIIFKEDLDVCMSLCQSSRFDEAYVLGTVDEEICTYDFLMLAKERMEYRKRL